MKPRIRIWMIAALALVALAGVFGLARGGNQPVPTLIAQETPSAEDEHIQQLRQMLANNNLSEEGRSSLQEKLEMAERLATQQAAGKAAGSAKRAAKDPGPAASSLMQMPTQAVAEGIFEGSQGLIRPSVADVANMWQGQWEGAVYQVFAGATAEEAPRGLVVVVTLNQNSPTGKQQMYMPPEEATRLRILEVQGQRLLLEDEKGSRIFFDLGTRTFEH